ncbi:hypothetical protein [Treponema sp.]|uniref:hypothetical protein n=1 Tax=Treponema sp. TaxID=166 RepID=UPI00298EB5C6|nr:hypothetical protein [Treponema sp.]
MMKKFYFNILLSFIFFSCTINGPKSGIVLWEYSPSLTYEKTSQYDFDEIKSNYPKSIFIDFEEVDKYSKSNHTFIIPKNKLHSEDDFEYLSHFNEIQFFSIYLNGKHYLTGVSYMCDLSAQIPRFPYENPVLLISTKNGGLKLSNTINDIDGEFGWQESDLSDYDFSEIENYFHSRNKLVK